MTDQRALPADQAGYADGLAGRPHGTDPLSQVDELAYASGYVEGKAARERAASREGDHLMDVGKEVPCDVCGGTGKFFELQDNIPATVPPEPVTKVCPRCNGTRFVGAE